MDRRLGLLSAAVFGAGASADASDAADVLKVDAWADDANGADAQQSAGARPHHSLALVR
jgi:hypothetical protein